MSSIKILKNFLVIARHKSVADAAKEIGLTAAAAGQQLLNLEDEIGIELFDRTKRSLTLNPYGKALIEPIQEIIGRYEALGSNLKTSVSGTITLGAIVSTLMGAFGQTLNNLKEAYPQLEVKLVAGLSSNFLDRVVDGTLDAAIVTESPYALPLSVQWTPLYSEPMIMIYPNNQNRHQETAKFSTTDLPFIRFEKNTWTGYLVDQTIKANRLSIQEGMEVNSVETIIELVRQGIGYSIVPMLANIPWKTDRLLFVKALPGKTIYRKVGLLERRNHARKNITQAIKKHFLSSDIAK